MCLCRTMEISSKVERFVSTFVAQGASSRAPAPLLPGDGSPDRASRSPHNRGSTLAGELVVGSATPWSTRFARVPAGPHASQAAPTHGFEGGETTAAARARARIRPTVAFKFKAVQGCTISGPR